MLMGLVVPRGKRRSVKKGVKSARARPQPERGPMIAFDADCQIVDTVKALLNYSPAFVEVWGSAVVNVVVGLPSGKQYSATAPTFAAALADVKAQLVIGERPAALATSPPPA